MVILSSKIVLLFAILFIAALSGFASEKVGIINIAINGMMIIGALSFALFGTFVNYLNPKGNSNWTQIFGFVFAMLITSLFALLHGLACIKFKANHIVAGLAINLLGSGIGLFFTNIPSFAVGNHIFNHYNILSFDKSQIANIFLFITIILFVIFFVIFKFSKIGLRYSSIGENPYASDSLGINVKKYQYSAIFLSGALAGLAGAAFSLDFDPFVGNVQGLGFIALALLIFGQWKIEYLFIGSLFFGILSGLGNFLPLLSNIPRSISDNSILFSILPFVLTIITMIIFSKSSRPPEHDGKHFSKDKGVI